MSRDAATTGISIMRIKVAGRFWSVSQDMDITRKKEKRRRNSASGDAVNIPVGVKHWHGAAKDSWFSHLAVEVPGENGSNEWLEAVDE